MRHIDPRVLDTETEGVNLPPGTLRNQLGDAPTLLVFLRHFGCPCCRQTVSDLRHMATTMPSYRYKCGSVWHF